MIDSMLLKKPDAEIFSLNTENFSENKLEELIESQSLFTKKYIVKISKAAEKTEFFELMMENLKEMKESENIFIWVEEKVKVADLKKIEKNSEKVQEFKIAEKKKNEFNGFSMADALGERNSKKLWTLYLEGLKVGRPEEIHGILWWQVKSMMIASKSGVGDSGLKPFVFNKSKKFAGNYSEEELENLGNRMMDVLHDSRLDGPSLDVGLERLILSL